MHIMPNISRIIVTYAYILIYDFFPSYVNALSRKNKQTRKPYPVVYESIRRCFILRSKLRRDVARGGRGRKNKRKFCEQIRACRARNKSGPGPDNRAPYCCIFSSAHSELRIFLVPFPA